ncbi:hypothetical protein ILYODFUR_030695 [Ilyodon furcidens]|uniref:Uncharacterized protein n=1 Tax=Ilyodon furcidens TaxID=33524 RepID=A0ABV0T3B5_9TELE
MRDSSWRTCSAAATVCQPQVPPLGAAPSTRQASRHRLELLLTAVEASWCLSPSSGSFLQAELFKQLRLQDSRGSDTDLKRAGTAGFLDLTPSFLQGLFNMFTWAVFSVDSFSSRSPKTCIQLLKNISMVLRTVSMVSETEDHVPCLSSCFNQALYGVLGTSCN